MALTLPLAAGSVRRAPRLAAIILPVPVATGFHGTIISSALQIAGALVIRVTIPLALITQPPPLGAAAAGEDCHFILHYSLLQCSPVAPPAVHLEAVCGGVTEHHRDGGLAHTRVLQVGQL